MNLDYASILSAGQGLVPNLQAQMLAQREGEARKQEIDIRGRALAAKEAEAVKDAQRRASFEADLDAFMAHPSPQGAAQMMLRHPEFADQFKSGWSALDDEQRRADLTQSGEIYYRAQNGDFEGAAEKLRTRIDADRAAGQDVETDEQVLADLTSGNQTRQKAAAGLIAFHTRAGDPEAFDKLFPQDKADPTELERKYRFLIQTRGLPYAEQWLSEQTQDVVVGQPGAPVFRKSDIIGGSGFQSEGGGQASGGAGLVQTGEPRTAPVARPEIMAAVKTGDWSGILGDPLRGRGGPPIAGGKYGAKRDYGSHNATDLTGEAGTPVYSSGGTGTVRVSRSKKGGNIVTVDHGGGLVTRYMHLGEVQVQDGQQVGPDTPLGTLGSTGRTSGPNLHFEVLANGKPVNPSKLGAINPVRSKQQYDRLPKGARYLAPDGSLRVKK